MLYARMKPSISVARTGLAPGAKANKAGIT
jgi:hypothetical protein